ncbi:glycoside hydrolase family 88 protein [Mangrovibacterium sp.]|uniref:glycoside hydrolase family 88 protein n=1 Tax=Mangrovibacterium sp. TaxID=1961364 RepID=UPI003567F0D9
MKDFIAISLITLLFAGCCNQSNDFAGLVKHSEKQFEEALEIIEPIREDSIGEFPRTFEDGKVKMVASADWTSGFFPGNLWMMYELTGKEEWKQRAIEFTSPLKAEQWNGSDHDIGFKMYCSYGRAIKFVDDPEYREILIQSAKTLATRYSPVVGCIRSWNNNPVTSHWKYPVIIDNMMNLELLLWAANETGNESFKEIAVSHALTTMESQFREDYSCYHVVDYDPETGEVLNRNTHQGAADESDWARGQGWAVYGYTMMYRETGIQEFLNHARKIADYLLTIDGMREGEIPYWDFEAPELPNEPYDASAAAVISSALFELYQYTSNEAYYKTADGLLASLSSPEFLAEVGQNGGFLLKHSTGSKPFNSEIDVPLVYADYYFLEALIRKNNCTKAEV